MVPPPSWIPTPHQLAAEEVAAQAKAEAEAQGRSWKSSLTARSLSSSISLPSRGSVLRVLTMTQNTSALVFSVFLIPHLASPVMASIAGLQGAEKTMMIARDLYLPLEPLLVYIPISVHLVSSLLRRLIVIIPPSTSKSESTSSETQTQTQTRTRSWSWKSLRLRLPRQTHQIIAYPLTILVLSHILTHRLIPSSPNPPISSLSPSELGWEFVVYNLQQGWSSWATYLALIGMGTWHACVGGMKVVSWLKGRSPRAIQPKQKAKSKAEAKPKSASGSASEQNLFLGSDSKPELEPGNTVSEAKTANTEPARPTIPLRRRIGLRALVVLFLGVITVGLGRVSRDTTAVSPSGLRVSTISKLMASRYKAVFDVPWAGFAVGLGGGIWR